MGQRLIVTIKNNNKDLAKIYYHWSAYSVSALQEARQIVDCIYNHEDETEKELQLRLIRFCEENGGGIRGDEKEFEYIQAMFPNETFKTDNYSRNNGLIALSETGMDELQKWSEGDIEIIIDEDIIYNTVHWMYDDIEEYKSNCAECDDEFDENMSIEDIEEIAYDLYEISVEDIDDVYYALRMANNFVVRYGNNIYELIA